MKFESEATGYYPTTPDDPNYEMEGGMVGASKWHGEELDAAEQLHTLDAFKRGDAPYVSVAMDNSKKNPMPYGTVLKSPQFPGVPFRVMDTGSAFKGKGTGRIDIARETNKGANSDENNRKITFMTDDEEPPALTINTVPSTSLSDVPIQQPEGGGEELNVSELTPIGTGEQPTQQETVHQANPVPNQSILASGRIPHASNIGIKSEDHNTGDVVFDDDTTKYNRRTGIVTKTIGDHQITSIPGQKPIVSKVESHTQLKDMTDPEGNPYIAVIDTQKGEVIKKLEDPSSRQWAQKQQVRARLNNLVKMQPAVVDFIRSLNNTKAIEEYAKLPDSQRNGASDLAFMQAYANVEHPGTSASIPELEAVEKSVPWVKRMGLHLKNIGKGESRVFDDKTIQQIAGQAKRSVDARRETYLAQIAPVIHSAAAAGVNPEDLISETLGVDASGLLDGISDKPRKDSDPPPPPVKALPPGAPVPDTWVVGSVTWDASGNKLYYTGANPSNKNDTANYSDKKP